MRRGYFVIIIICLAATVLLFAGCQDAPVTTDKTTEATHDIHVSTPEPTAEPTDVPVTPEPTPEIMVIDPVGDDWPAEFLQFPKYSGDGALVSSELSEDRHVMTRTYSKMSEYSIANYQEQLRHQDFVSNDHADFLRGLDTVILKWSYTVNGSTGSVTFRWEISPVEE